MAETLSVISVGSFLGAGIFAVLAVVLWFTFRIPTVAGDLSGRNAKRSIELMRKNNEKTGIKYYGADNINIKRGKLTEAVGIGKNNEGAQKQETGLLKENKARGYQSAVTEFLVESGNGQDGEKGTLVLQKEGIGRRDNADEIKIILLEEIICIHTEEVI